jgi:imidazolonepropionase-like amidohydrolase
VFAAVAAVVLGAFGTAEAETVVFRNFTAFDGTGKAPVANSAMIVTDGRIKWIGAAAALKAPAGADSVDLAGKFVIPGLIDSHVHLANTKLLTEDKAYYTRDYLEHDLKTYAAYGVTSVLSVGTDNDIVFPLRAEQRKSGRPSMARVFTAGQGLYIKDGYGGLANFNIPVTTAAEARAQVDAQAAKGVDVIKLWIDDVFGTWKVKMPYDITAAIIDEAKKKKLRTVAHVYYMADAQTLIDQGVNGFVHMVRDQPVTPEFISSMKAHNVWQVSGTLSREWSNTYVLPPYVDDPFFTNAVPPALIPLLKSPARVNGLATGPNWPKFPAVLKNGDNNFKAFVDAGINVGAGTDSGPPGRFHGFFMHLELEEMVKAGLTPSQALVAATSGNARFLNANDLGALAAGKWADFDVLDASPLADIKNSRKISAVYIAGKPVPTIWQLCEGRPANACAPATR